MSPGKLFAAVEAYASFGDHRTGTAVDRVTREWLATELAARGLAVREEPFSFERYDARWEVTADGTVVSALPLFYRSCWSVSAAQPWLASATPLGAEGLAGLDEIEAAASAAGRRAVVLANGLPGVTPPDQLFAVNRSAASAGSTASMPVLSVSADDLERLRRGSAKVEFTAEIVPGQTADLVAERPGVGRPLLLTTPMNGWFGCAGERGSGIAILLDLVERFTDRPLLVVATAGHELGGLGAIRQARQLQGRVAAVVHVGASVAVVEPVLQRVAVRGGAIEGAVDGDAVGWRGEASEWSRLGVPIVSWTGGFRWFHTPADLPAAATTPELLAAQAVSIGAVVEQLLGA